MEPSELIGRFSHEIRNPLTLINSSLQLLEHEQPSLLGCALWPQIRKDLQDVIRLLNDLSTLNKSGKIMPAAILVSDLLSGIDASVRPLMEENNIAFSLAIDPALSGTCLFADPVKIREAIINLLVNAIDAVSEIKREKQILLHATQSEQITSHSDGKPTLNGVSIHIRDNGSGIPVEYMDTLFEPFVTHKSRGTGLGLGIVRNIADLHGGSIHVDTCTSPQNSYTDFCLWLPLAQLPE